MPNRVLTFSVNNATILLMQSTNTAPRWAKPQRVWKGEDVAGFAVVLGLIAFFVILARLYARHDRPAAIRARIEREQEWRRGMHELRAAERDPGPPDPTDAPEPEPKKATVKAEVAALPDRITTEDLRAMSPEARAKILAGVRSPKK